MAATQVKCPSCSTLLQLAALPPAGSGIKCPKCGQVFRVAAPAPISTIAPKPAPPPQPAKAAPVRPAPVAAQPNEKAAPRPAAAPKPVAKPVAIPVRKPVQDDADDLPPPKRRVVDDDDEFDVEPVRRRPPVDDDEDDDDDRPVRRSREPKKSNKKLLIVAIAVLLVAGVAIGGTVWVVKSLFGGKPDTVAEATDKQEEKPEPKGNGLDVRFVSSDFFAAAVVNVPRALKAKVVDSALPKEQLSAMPEQVGFDLNNLEQVVILLELTPGGKEPVSPGFVFRFKEGVDGKFILGKLVNGGRKVPFEGKSYLRGKPDPKTGVPEAGHVADKQTILIAPEPTLKKMLAAKGDGPLAGRMKDLDLKTDVAAAFVMGPVREPLKEYIKESGIEDGLPPDFADLPKVPDWLQGGHLALDLSGETLLKVTLEAKDTDGTAGMEKMLSGAVGFLKQIYPQMRKQYQKQLPKEFAKPVLDVLDQVPKGITVGHQGTEVTVSLKSPKGLDALGATLDSVFKSLDEARANTARIGIAKIEQAVGGYRNSHNQEPPPSLQVLTVPENGKAAYLEEKDLIDPWGKPYEYDPSQRSVTGKPLIRTTTPGGVTIANWK